MTWFIVAAVIVLIIAASEIKRLENKIHDLENRVEDLEGDPDEVSIGD